MRAIAALLVVASHSVWKGSQYSSAPMSWFKVGDIGVDLFFVISGFIMCHVTYERKITFSSFMKARFIRILPLYWVLTGIALVIYLTFPDKINSSRGETSVLYSFLLFPNEDRFLVSNGWTLSYEFYFYLIFAVGLFFSNIYRYVIPIIMLVTLVLIGFIVTLNNVQFDFLTNTRLLEFVCGMLIFFFFVKYSINKTLSILLIIISILILYLVNLTGGLGNEFINYIVPVIFFFIGMRGLEETCFSKKPGKIRISLDKIGNSSYSLYLFHPFSLVLSSIVLNELGITDYGYLFIGLLLLVSILTSYFVYIHVELRINKVVKKLLS